MTALVPFAHPFECMCDPPNPDIVGDIIEHGESHALSMHAERQGFASATDRILVRILGDSTGGCGDSRVIIAPPFVARYFGWKASASAIAKHLADLRLVFNTDYFAIPATDEAARAISVIADELAPLAIEAPVPKPTKKKRSVVAAPPFYAVTRATLRDIIARSRMDSAQELRTFLARLDAIMPDFNRARYHVISEQSYRGGMRDADGRARMPAPEEYIYIATTKAYETRDIYKVGRAKNLQSRLSSYNTGRAADDCMFYKFHAACYNPAQVEAYILQVTREFIDQNEMRAMPYEILARITRRAIRCDKKCAKIAWRARTPREAARDVPIIEEAPATVAETPRKPRKSLHARL
jgi:hypothetical protein